MKTAKQFLEEDQNTRLDDVMFYDCNMTWDLLLSIMERYGQYREDQEMENILDSNKRKQRIVISKDLPDYFIYQIPHKCPICGGRGTVPHGFYGITTSSTVSESCRSCVNGIIWR